MKITRSTAETQASIVDLTTSLLRWIVVTDFHGFEPAPYEWFGQRLKFFASPDCWDEPTATDSCVLHLVSPVVVLHDAGESIPGTDCDVPFVALARFSWREILLDRPGDEVGFERSELRGQRMRC